jgi:hypothetical protein
MDKRELILRALSKRLNVHSRENLYQPRSNLNTYQIPLSADPSILQNIVSFLDEASDIISLALTCQAFIRDMHDGVNVWEGKKFVLHPPQYNEHTRFNFVRHFLKIYNDMYRSGCYFSALQMHSIDCTYLDIYNLPKIRLLGNIELHNMNIPFWFFQYLLRDCRAISISLINCEMEDLNNHFQIDPPKDPSQLAGQYLRFKNLQFSHLSKVNMLLAEIKASAPARKVVEMTVSIKADYSLRKCIKPNQNSWSKEAVFTKSLAEFYTAGSAIFTDPLQLELIKHTVLSNATQWDSPAKMIILGGATSIDITEFVRKTTVLHLDPLNITKLKRVMHSVTSLTVRLVTPDSIITSEHLEALTVCFPKVKELTLIDTYFYSEMRALGLGETRVYSTASTKNETLISLRLIHTHRSRLQSRTYCSVEVFRRFFPKVNIKESLKEKNICKLGREETEEDYSWLAVDVTLGKEKFADKVLSEAVYEEQHREWDALRKILRKTYYTLGSQMEVSARMELAKTAFSEQFIPGLSWENAKRLQPILEMNSNTDMERLSLGDRAKVMFEDYELLAGQTELATQVRQVIADFEAAQSCNDAEIFYQFNKLERCCYKMVEVLKLWPYHWSLSTRFAGICETNEEDDEFEYELDDMGDDEETNDETEDEMDEEEDFSSNTKQESKHVTSSALKAVSRC